MTFFHHAHSHGIYSKAAVAATVSLSWFNGQRDWTNSLYSTQNFMNMFHYATKQIKEHGAPLCHCRRCTDECEGELGLGGGEGKNMTRLWGLKSWQRIINSLLLSSSVIIKCIESPSDKSHISKVWSQTLHFYRLLSLWDYHCWGEFQERRKGVWAEVLAGAKVWVRVRVCVCQEMCRCWEELWIGRERGATEQKSTEIEQKASSVNGPVM